MKTYELMLEVRRLSAVKAKNEASLSEEELQGKYRKSYERLCSDLREKQCELRVRYVNACKQLQEVMAESVYAPTGKEYEWLHDEITRRVNASNEDALLKSLFLIFWIFFDDEMK
ncbi:hypothetical protein [Parablautia sp. Marseille-Q6255]|uniref:hypothetical protein n=1 Tax=Parablautia sp. Marseille-Q6255 TaxID=3039593 RepID=UPI0024BCF6A7|nr:hypothetical protein [Parablautia sp. Marseille-Q6255]